MGFIIELPHITYTYSPTHAASTPTYEEKGESSMQQRVTHIGNSPNLREVKGVNLANGLYLHYFRSVSCVGLYMCYYFTKQNIGDREKTLDSHSTTQ